MQWHGKNGVQATVRQEGSGVAAVNALNCLVPMEFSLQVPCILHRFMSCYPAFAQTTGSAFFPLESFGRIACGERAERLDASLAAVCGEAPNCAVGRWRLENHLR